MAAKTSDWRPGPTVCRCCLTEGCYKDISTEYFWMGKREVYSEMLSETLDVSISYSKSGGPNSNSRLICEPCIARLRDASDFKRQVLECEKTFMQHLDSGSVSAEKEDVLTLKEVKVELVKQEGKLSDDDDDFEERVDFVVENDDTDDDLDNEPLMKLATKVPKKEVELLDLLDNSEITVKRKSTSTKTKEPPAKKVKKREIVIKPSASKASASSDPQVVKKKKEITPNDIERRNASLLLQYTTALPFKLPCNNITCIVCFKEFLQPERFRLHMSQEENLDSVLDMLSHISKKTIIKIDITNLCCRFCSEDFDDIEEIARHLYFAHHVSEIDLKHDLGVHPHKFHMDNYSCILCPQRFVSIRALSRHTQTHYFKHTCETCGKSYVTLESLNAHTLMHQRSKFFCRKCKEEFSSVEEKDIHILHSQKCWLYTCDVCGDRFRTLNLRLEHIRIVHNIEHIYPCPECPKVFQNPRNRFKHFVGMHTNKYKCDICDKTFSRNRYLANHLTTHPNVKVFQCNICSKRFSSKKLLKQHMFVDDCME